MCIMVIVSFIMVNLQPYTALFVFVFMAATLHFSFFNSPWVEGEIWPFLKVSISPKPKRSHPPKLVYMYVTSTLA